jgi:hypothetical protein
VGGVSFEWSGDFDLHIEALAAEATKGVATALQATLDGVAREYGGQPLDVIKPVLAKRWAETGGTLTDPQLTEYATILSEGGRIEVRA